MKHTKGKWEVEKEDNIGQLWICDDSIGSITIAQICHGELENGDLEITKEEKANAERIVKCVNGWDDLELELLWEKTKRRKYESENKKLGEALKGFTEAGYPIADDKFQVLLNQAKKLL